MFLASGLNAAPATHVTFASCGSLLIQYSKSSVSLAFAWVSHSQGIPFWAYILALICNLLSLDFFQPLFPETAPGFLCHADLCLRAQISTLACLRLCCVLLAPHHPRVGYRVFLGKLPGMDSHHH